MSTEDPRLDSICPEREATGRALGSTRRRQGWRSAAPALLLIAMAACQPEEDAEPQAPQIPLPEYREVITEQLAKYEGEGLPELEEQEIHEVRELLETLSVEGRIGRMARRDLEGRDKNRLCSALLSIVEDRFYLGEARQPAYAWLYEYGSPAIVPRLILRLKYEKDWVANVDLIRTLLKYDNGAGLEGLQQILIQGEAANQDIALARSLAAEALKELPPIGSSWAPNDDFQNNWAGLQQHREAWNTRSQLASEISDEDDGEATAESEELSPAVRAELWRMLVRLNSQPLRPVDDARFVLGRFGPRAIPDMSMALEDASLYVREGVLQTLSWMGPSVGQWCRRSGADYLGAVRPLLGDERIRPRVLTALGASGLPEAAADLEPWLLAGSREERTSAASALLRCAETDSMEAIESALQRPDRLSAEARYSLELLRATLDPELDPAERLRRQTWHAQREHRAAAE